MGQISHYLYLTYEGRIDLTADYVSHNTGADISSTFFFIVLFSYVVVGIVFSLFLRNIKSTIYEAVKNEVATSQLCRYFSPKVRDQIMSEEGQKAMNRGHQKNVVVLFSDIRNFTTFCESRTPEEVVAFLKDYHSRMVAAIYKFSGTLDKFIGDGIMATFGTPLPTENDSENALNAALEMVQALETMNRERLSRGEAEIQQGIGIHYGPAIVGNVGSEERLEYTVIGDAVNIASRLESSTKELGEKIIISSELNSRISDQFSTTLKGSVALKGRNEPVEVYSVQKAK
jgi:adenylate cyclase